MNQIDIEGIRAECAQLDEEHGGREINADEIVRVLREAKELPTDFVMHAADLIESLQAQLTASQRRAQTARNELCLKCGRYREAHNGACDGCRWKE